MSRVLKLYGILLVLTLVMLIAAGFNSVSANDDTRAEGTLTVPTWNIGDKWGYKVPQYTYASEYYGIGFEVVDTENLNGIECYKVKIWWDSSYGDTDSSEVDFQIPGYSSTYKYVGHAYFTKDKLALAKFSMELEMKMQFDGSKISSLLGSRADTTGDDSSYITDMISKMKDWKYDIDYSLNIDYVYEPPFVICDYPLEVGKKWSSNSTVTVSWEYSTDAWMNDAMKEDIKELSQENSEMDFENEDGSGASEYTISGSFDIIGEDTIYTDTGEHQVFIIQYNIYTSGARAVMGSETTEPPEDYGEIEVPGETATMELVGGTTGSGKSYYDATNGYPQKMENGYSYFSDTYTSVDPETVENSYNNLAKSSKKDSNPGVAGIEIDENTSTLLLIFGLAVSLIVILIVVLFLLNRRTNRHQPQAQTGRAQYQNPYPYPAGQNENQNRNQNPYGEPRPRQDTGKERYSQPYTQTSNQYPEYQNEPTRYQ